MCVNKVEIIRSIQKKFYKVVLKIEEDYYAPISGVCLGRIGEEIKANDFNQERFTSMICGWNVAHYSDHHRSRFSVLNYKDAQKLKDEFAPINDIGTVVILEVKRLEKDQTLEVGNKQMHGTTNLIKEMKLVKEKI